MPEPVAVMQVPDRAGGATTAADPCSDPAVQQAVQAGDDAATVAGFGGGAAFREAVVAGNAPASRSAIRRGVWVVVNKSLPLKPADYEPGRSTPCRCR